MTPRFQKLNIGNYEEIFILNAPKEFTTEISALKKSTNVSMSLKKAKQIKFLLAFVKSQKEIDILIPPLPARLSFDAALWMAYPKGTSKKYRTEINRDRGWDILGVHGFVSVRQITLDEDWSALCFHRAEFIKSSTRDFASEDDRNLVKKISS